MKIESAAPVAGIILREVCTRARVTSDVEEAPGKCVRGKRLKAFAGKGYGARKAQFQVLGWLKADLLPVNKGPWRKAVSGKAAKEGIVTQSAEQRKIKRHRAGDAQHVEGLGIIAYQHRTRFSWSPSEALFTDRDLMREKCGCDIGVEQTKLID